MLCEIPSAPHSQPGLRKNPSPRLIFGLLLALIVLAGTYVGFKRHNDRIQREQARAAKQASDRARLQSLEAKAQAAFAAYQKETLETVDAISRLEAATETGVNLMRYSELLADVNYRVKKFKEDYADKVEQRFPGTVRTLESMEAYVEAASAWRTKNEVEYGKYEYEEKLQEAWSRGTESLKQARAALKTAPGREVWREPQNYKDYIRQLSGSESDAQFAEAHQKETQQRFRQETLACESNQQALTTALEIWSKDNNGRYPVALVELKPKYLKQIPGCAKNGEYEFESTAATGPPDLFTLACRGTHPPVNP
jgi:type II secretory pathway pseudopilin PulG